MPRTSVSEPMEQAPPVWRVAELFPPQGEWSEEEYLDLPTNRLVEFTDGRLEFLPMPDGWHQWIAQLFFVMLRDYVVARRLGMVYFAPLPIQLRPGKYREPDILFIRSKRMPDMTRPPDGADLVFEVLSKGRRHRRRDLVQKRAEYAEAGIPEYWIADPEAQSVSVLTLSDRSYAVHGEFGAGSVATSILLPEFRVAVSDLFAPPPPEATSKD